MANEYIGRRESVGVGIEATSGTAVAPQEWIKHLSLGLQRKTKKVTNESGIGRVEKVNESAVTQQWAEGSLEGKVSDVTIGYLLYNIFGSVVTTDNADTNPVVKDHTFNTLQSNTPPSLTFTKKTPLSVRRHAGAQLDSLRISVDNGEWVKFEAAIKAGPGTTTTATAAYIAENEFTSKHVTVKLAANVAGLGAASALGIKQMSLDLTRPSTLYFPAGQVGPSTATTGSWEASGELVLRYNVTDMDDDTFSNAVKAMSITLNNTDVTIGAAANPKIIFTAPQVTLATFDTSTDLDEIVEQTIGFTCELSLTDGYALRAVLTNAYAAYAAA